jgi:hypothetical protein
VVVRFNADHRFDKKLKEQIRFTGIKLLWAVAIITVSFFSSTYGMISAGSILQLTDKLTGIVPEGCG